MNIVNRLAGEQRQDYDDHDELRISLGPYLLGALDESESRQVFGHLAECPVCREEYGWLLDVRRVLDSVGDVAFLEQSSAAEPRRGPAARRRRRPVSRRRRLGLAAAGAVLASTAGVAGVLLVGNHAGAPAAHAVSVTGADGITAVVRFRPEAWGTWVQVKMSAVPADYTCTLTAVGKDGRGEVAATWSADPGKGTVTVPGAVAIPAAAIDHFDVAVAPGIDLVVPAG